MAADPHSRSIFTLCDIIRDQSRNSQVFAERVHRKDLRKRTRESTTKKEIKAEQQRRMKVFDEDGTLLGLLTADLFLDERVICEIKGCSALVDAHTAQLLGYLRAARIEHGLLINFGAPRLEIKKYILT